MNLLHTQPSAVFGAPTTTPNAAARPYAALVVAGTLAALVGGCASTPPAMPAQPVPAAINAPTGTQRAFVHHARGVQIYECRLAEGAAAPAWAFVAPEAQLFADAGSSAVLGTHGAGPFWQAADGSRIVGTVKARADAPAAGSIPWLLLATTAQGGNAGGQMGPVTNIQRIHTAGGVAPASGCATRADAGQRVRVPYTADYVYFKG
jgi:hypothetical protein